MGRRENAVAATTRQAEVLALWLRAQRRNRGLTYAAMAKKIDHRFTPSMLSRGAGGRVPTRDLVLAYARACDADTTRALALWKQARRAEAEEQRLKDTPEDMRELAARVGHALAHPDLIENYSQLRRAMVQLRARDGQPSLAELQARAGLSRDGRRHRLPTSSLSAVLRGEAVPRRDHLTAFLEALAVSPRRLVQWQRAWDRIAEKESGHRPPALRLLFLSDDPALPGRNPDTGGGGVPRDRTPPAGHSTRGSVTFELDPLHPRGLHIRTTSTPAGWTGPRPPRPYAGQTPAGLPIRSRRYYPPPPRNPPALQDPAPRPGPGRS
ncbi:helix-turn-helix domain-containing protein [Streptomyces clavuligerus]|uniref:helix-turn-helix domain-containing protein n=4 Tax=Streptomyces clavuligerus TaxID=1901 RepID=UPI00020D9416|nr:helix-turn-helix transcriptional regulator [Streptomyces clavuligerus]WDN56111.1 helix-turn-helix transcriptional regulator [Streptomyces clavuligerus]